MRHTLKCAVCILMTIAMLFSMVVCAGAVAADTAEVAADSELASTGVSGTVYFKNTANWSTVNAYVWIEGTTTAVQAWPGQAMTLVKDNIYKYTISGDYNMIIFNNGGDQTKDLSIPGANQLYDFSTGSWSAYTDDNNNTDPTTPVVNPTTPVNPSGAKAVYLKNSANWSTVNCYMWRDGAGENAAWPGASMTSIGDGVFQYNITGNFNKIIFNSGGSQTGDMDLPGDGYIYDNQSGTWDVYDTSAIKVSNFGANLTSPQYKGTDITLSATATSVSAVSYKFSVTGPSGTTVVSDFSSRNTAVWTPTAAGTYTITFDFKDASGNTNQRTATFVIEDDANVSLPILKGVSPKPGQMKKGTQQTLAINAAGGKTGTNLLFYKVKITDPSGNTCNVPYYTKSTAYSFTPTALGKYTVTIYVQASDNETVERSYVYESVNTVVDPVEPTTPTPTNPTPTNPTPTNPTPGDYLKGDADMDTVVTVLDATMIQLVLAQMRPTTSLNYKNADVDGDTLVTVLDATRIQLHLAGKIEW